MAPADLVVRHTPGTTATAVSMALASTGMRMNVTPITAIITIVTIAAGAAATAIAAGATTVAMAGAVRGNVLAACTADQAWRVCFTD